MNYKYKISNIDCPVCSEKICQKISNLDAVNSSKLDYLNKILNIEVSGKMSDELLGKIKKCVKDLEPDADIFDIDSYSKESIGIKGKMLINMDTLEIFLAILFLSIGVLLKGAFFYLSFLLSIASVIVCGHKIFLSGLKSILRLKFDEKALLTIAVIAAFLLGETAEAAMVILLFRIGNVLENRAVIRSKNSIRELSKIIPDKVNLLFKDKERKIPIDNLKEGDIILVYPFERVPCDGVVLEGNSEMDQSAITGESIPVSVSKGDKLMSGSINNSGKLIVRATKKASESTVSRILRLIENAVGNKSNSENIITKFAEIYTPIVLIIAVIIAVFPPLLFGLDFITWIKRALVLLVASCPCAIVISIPLAFCIGIGVASKFGVLFKGGRYMEVLSKIDTIAFDKTATLTKGELSLEKVYSYGSFDEKNVLKLAASMEKYSSHPLANVIKNSFKGSLFEIVDLKEIPGLGLEGLINGKKVLCGKKDLLLKNGIGLDGIESFQIYLSVGESVVGAISFKDTIRHDAKDTIKALKKLGIKNIAILSGDEKGATESVAKKCDIKEYYYRLMPEDKLKIFKDLQKKSKAAAFIGDGINDTPTLVTADCGISMGLGTGAAIESSDVVLTGDSISVLNKAISLSRKVMFVIKLNLFMSLLVKFVVLFLACVGLAPMWLAVLSDTGLTLIAVLNSSLIIREKKKK